jgi:hypothetical protein
MPRIQAFIDFVAAHAGFKSSAPAPSKMVGTTGKTPQVGGGFDAPR